MSSSSSLPASSPRTARTRELLLQAGLELFSEQAVDAVAVDQIVDHAGVAKGSFFNHFADKRAFAAAVADGIRTQLEAQVRQANEGISDPFSRLARGMTVAATFALQERKRTLVMLRSADHLMGVRHPLNNGVSDDIRAAVVSGMTRSGVADWGVLYWLGLCQVLMADVATRSPTRNEVTQALAVMVTCGLTGLGLPEGQASRISGHEKIGYE